MNRNILFYDTETTGFPNNKEALSHHSQPHLVQIAAILVNEGTRKIASSIDLTIRGPVPAKITEITGVTQEMANSVGVDEEIALRIFRELYKRADLVVGHNVAFDEKIIGIAANRYNCLIMGKKTHCTMHETTDICRLPGKFGKYKWPKLSEAYKMLMGKDLVNAHTALADTQACMELYFHLEDLRNGR